MRFPRPSERSELPHALGWSIIFTRRRQNMKHSATILMTEFVTHDVKKFILTKPRDFDYQPGQGVKLVINEPKWRKEEDHPFTPISLRDDKVLEFTIKRYADREGVTNRLHSLEVGAKLFISDAFGTITYKGPGVFLAAGAGVTPFIAISRQLAREGKLEPNSLIFSNKTPADVICEKELQHYFGARCILTCTRKSGPGYEDRKITAEFLKEKIGGFSQRFYVCGPDSFVEQIKSFLTQLGASPDSLVFEE
jgi:ferredoxin-NADP reductase